MGLFHVIWAFQHHSYLTVGKLFYDFQWKKWHHMLIIGASRQMSVDTEKKKSNRKMDVNSKQVSTNLPLPQPGKLAPCTERGCWAGRAWMLGLALAPPPAGFSGTSVPLYTLHCPPAKYWLPAVPWSTLWHALMRLTPTFSEFDPMPFNLSRKDVMQLTTTYKSSISF